MHDILPEDQPYYQKISNIVRDVAKFYGFQKIDTPILENAELFSIGIGLSTDIVEKQMYIFKTRGGDLVAMRPEGTASVARAYIQHGMFALPQPVKLWYEGPFFRYEHPQAGRWRQFNQFGFEVLGEDNPVIDAQIIQIFFVILDELKFRNLICNINNIGDSQCRPYYKKVLVNYLRSKVSSLCFNCRRRVKENPLRVLDCKEEKCQPVKAQAPQIVDHLCQICHDHLKEVLEFLEELQLPYYLDPFLVRGLDYYTKTVFEIYEKESDKEIDLFKALVGGGRYDNLVKMLGGKNVPACGGAAGIERIIEVLKAKGVKVSPEAKPKVFIAPIGPLAKRKALNIIEQFRKAKIPIAESLAKDALKTQLGRADKARVLYTIILGQKEAIEGTVIIRDMAKGKQEVVKLDQLVREIKKRLKS